ncbi:hypothetical protein [Streptomyces sp. NBC_00566]|uniref:hypothetical protein n=1 Tax=Streptomyces sp. NBC_00566 TaxID=2975778 RepID=UPI002E80855D|nr:hypothetical protein [Streptomyces sp. NBC_00566]WUB87178.1 hypothetical protein OG812_11515 [Streptomyces sp. NBC_00566]
MSLVELIAQADARGLAASGLACSDRCVSLLVEDDELLRPLWAHLVDDSDWSESLLKACAALGPADPGEGEAAGLAREMLASAPAERTGEALRAWADACSLASLRVHRLLDPADPAEPSEGAATAEDDEAVRGEDGADEAPPLVAAELGRQIVVLQLLAEHGPQGLRRALDVSGEGRRVLRAVVSRRARGRG